MTERYFLKITVEREVSKSEWVEAERACGFHNTMGRPDEPATAGFTHHNGPVHVEGTVKRDGPESFEEALGLNARA